MSARPQGGEHESALSFSPPILLSAQLPKVNAELTRNHDDAGAINIPHPQSAVLAAAAAADAQRTVSGGVQ